jgi:hypothetical protein
MRILTVFTLPPSRSIKYWHPRFTSHRRRRHHHHHHHHPHHHHYHNTGKTENPSHSMWKTTRGGTNHNSSPSPVTQGIGHMRGYLNSHKCVTPSGPLSKLLSTLARSARALLPLILNSCCEVRLSNLYSTYTVSNLKLIKVSYYITDP